MSTQTPLSNDAIEVRGSTTLAQKNASGVKFWLVILAINTSFFLALLESSAISTALPTIVDSLNGTDFIWVGASYNLASTAFMPSAGGLSEVFGRRPMLLGALFLFALGSALCGASSSITFLIAGRAVQGTGGAGLFAVSSIVLSDIVPLQKRGLFNGILQLTWCLAAGIGPVIGGTLAQKGSWRWLFYLNIPIAGVGLLLVLFFLRLPIPAGTIHEKLRRIDWTGNTIIIGSSAACAIGMTWGGVNHPWSSLQVLLPVCAGVTGFICFGVYESKWASHPIVPCRAIANRTTLSGYIQTSVLLVAFISLVFYVPVYFQACKLFSPIHSGIGLFGLAFSTTIFAILSGISVTVLKRYRIQSWLGWSFALLGTGLMSTIDRTSPTGVSIAYQILAGIGFGTLYSTTYFPVLAPLPLSESAHALAFFQFLRQFAQVWAITVGGTILQNELQARLPPEFFVHFPRGTSIEYAAIPSLHEIQQPLLGMIQSAFADSLRRIWWVMTGVVGFGLLASLFMREVSLHHKTDEKWDLKEDSVPVDISMEGR